MGRLGRPRNVMAQRYPSGDPRPSAEEIERRKAPRGERVDPTPEVTARRAALFDDPKAWMEECCPIDRLAKQLTEEQYHAGRYARSTYARYCIAIGAPRLVAGQLSDFIQGGGGSPMDHDQAMEAVKQYHEMVTIIRRYSLRSLKEVERVTHGSMPRSVDVLRGGLTALAEYLGLYRRDVA